MSAAEIRIVGEPVVVSYLTDPVISRGRFRLENHGNSTAQTAVELAWVRIGQQRRDLSHISLFDVDTDRQLDPNQIEVAPGEIVTFLLGFPRIPYKQEGNEVSVGIRLAGSLTPIETESPVRLIRRIPRTRGSLPDS
jgi:hypothetical protein